MPRAPRAAAALGLVAALGSPAPAEEAGPDPGVSEISACIRANAPRSTMRQRLEMTSVDRMGDERNFDVKGEWKRSEDGLSKVLLRVSAPPDLRGTAFLLLEQADRSDDMFSYLPELQKVRRISGRTAAGSLFGTDFSYEDFERVQNLAESASSRQLEDAAVEDRRAWVVEGTPAAEEQSEYTRVVGYVDAERCVPLKAEFYGRGEKPEKVLTVPPERVVREGDRWIPMEMTMRDVAAETHSVVRVKDVELDVEIPDRTFSQSALQRRR